MSDVCCPFGHILRHTTANETYRFGYECSKCGRRRDRHSGAVFDCVGCEFAMCGDCFASAERRLRCELNRAHSIRGSTRREPPRPCSSCANPIDEPPYFSCANGCRFSLCVTCALAVLYFGDDDDQNAADEAQNAPNIAAAPVVPNAPPQQNAQGNNNNNDSATDLQMAFDALHRAMERGDFSSLVQSLSSSLSVSSSVSQSEAAAQPQNDAKKDAVVAEKEDVDRQCHPSLYKRRYPLPVPPHKLE